MEYKPDHTIYYFLLAISVTQLIAIFNDTTLDIQSLLVTLVMILCCVLTIAHFVYTLVLKPDGIYKKKFYQRTADLIISYNDIQSLTAITSNQKCQTLEIYSRQHKLTKIQNIHPEFNAFLLKLATYHPVNDQTHQLDDSLFGQKVSKGGLTLLFTTSIAFILAGLIHSYFIRLEHLSFESFFNWTLMIYLIATVLTFGLLRLVNKKTAFVEALIVNLLLAPSLTGLGISINRCINENTVTPQIEIPVYLYENRETKQVWKVDHNAGVTLPDFIKNKGSFYFDQPKNTTALPTNTRKTMLAQHGRLNDIFITPDNLRKLQTNHDVSLQK